VGKDLEKGPFSVGREPRAGPPSFRLFTKMAKINRPHVRVPEKKEHPVEERPSLALRDCSYVIPGESPCPTTDDREIEKRKGEPLLQKKHGQVTGKACLVRNEEYKNPLASNSFISTFSTMSRLRFFEIKSSPYPYSYSF
jgi:hypothetical protein